MKDSDLTGIYDSGVGGLSVLKEFLPLGGKFIYFGDTKNLPYGSKTKEEIINFTRSIVEFFISRGAKRVIMACNTSSALAYETLNSEYGNKIKIHPLIQTAAPYIAKTAENIGIMATQGTVKSLSYTKEIKKYNPNAKVHELACPDFVKIVENRLYNEKSSVEYIKGHLETLLKKGCEKIVLGCTHYPYLLPVLEKFAPAEIFINPAIYMKNSLKNEFDFSPLNLEFYVSSHPDEFKKNAEIFMHINEDVRLVFLETSVISC